MLFIALLPGLPMIPFLFLSVVTGYGAWKVTQEQEAVANNKVFEETMAEQKESRQNPKS